MRIALVVLVSCMVVALGCSSDKANDEKAPPKAASAADKPAAKKEAPKPAAKKADWSAMKVSAPEGWEGEYNKALESWTFEKYTPAGDGTNSPNRFYAGEIDSDAPTEAAAYADKLQKDKMFQDFGYVYSKVDTAEKAGDGWLILGEVTDTNDKDAKPEPGFVMFRDVGGVRLLCRGSTFQKPELRKEAIAACKSASW